MAEKPNNNTTPPTDSTPTLIAKESGKEVFGLNNTINSDLYGKDFYYNILPFKVKEILSTGGGGEYICYWTSDDKLLFSGYLNDKNFGEQFHNYFFKYNLTFKEKYINENMTELFEFKWKDFINNKLTTTIKNDFTKIKKVYILNSGCVIIELDNGILFYYYLQKGFYDIIPVNNVKWMMGGIMNLDKVFIYTNLNELFTFQEETLEKVNLDFLLQQLNNNNSLIRLAAISACQVNVLVTEDNKIYMKVLQNAQGFNKNVTNDFEYRKTPFEKQSKIIDIKGGFSHFIVLLENGKVYSIGFNNLSQLGVNSSVTEKTYGFNQIILKTREDIFVDKIFVSSRGTVLRTDTEFIFLGEVIHNFRKKSMIPNITNSYILKRKEGNRKWNTVCCGPWSYLVYYKEENNTKDMKFFVQNLKKVYGVDINLTHDIELAFK